MVLRICFMLHGLVARTLLSAESAELRTEVSASLPSMISHASQSSNSPFAALENRAHARRVLLHHECRGRFGFPQLRLQLRLLAFEFRKFRILLQAIVRNGFLLLRRAVRGGACECLGQFGRQRLAAEVS